MKKNIVPNEVKKLMSDLAKSTSGLPDNYPTPDNGDGTVQHKSLYRPGEKISGYADPAEELKDPDPTKAESNAAPQESSTDAYRETNDDLSDGAPPTATNEHQNARIEKERRSKVFASKPKYFVKAMRKNAA